MQELHDRKADDWIAPALTLKTAGFGVLIIALSLAISVLLVQALEWLVL